MPEAKGIKVGQYIFKHYPLTEKEAEKWEESVEVRGEGKFKKHAEEKLTAVVRALDSVRVSIKLNGGTKDGKVVLLGVSLGSLSTSGYDDQKVMNIVELCRPVLSKDVYSTKETKVTTLSTN